MDFENSTFPYAADPAEDEFQSLCLPEPSICKYLVIFRVVIIHSTINVLFQVPLDAFLQLEITGPPPAEPYKKIVTPVEGHIRYSQGQCIACGARTRLYKCSGCKMHGLLQGVPN